MAVGGKANSRAQGEGNPGVSDIFQKFNCDYCQVFYLLISIFKNSFLLIAMFNYEFRMTFLA